MMRLLLILILLTTTVTAVKAGEIEKDNVRQIIEAAYPGAKIAEIETERYQGEPVYEVDFRHDGQKLEAIVSLDGELLKVAEDD